MSGWDKETPTVVVVHEDEEGAAKSFRNLDRVLVTVPSELEVADVVWARSLVVSEAALPLVQLKAGSAAGEAGDARPEDRAPSARRGATTS